ncbi:MAG TPA: pyridoxamine 5'-phosphate oxidase family protein [Dehalococcoidia bacterium]|nr:pyridoxamine 5'-phosphate oxidase family protein [Dehalococcoidia bacterium]
MPLLDQDGREALLAEVRVAVLSVARSEGGPLAVPIWYEYRDGLLWMDTETSNLHGRLMQARGRATLTVQDDQVPYRYVTAEGPVEFRGDEPEVARRIAVRYIGDEGA